MMIQSIPLIAAAAILSAQMACAQAVTPRPAWVRHQAGKAAPPVAEAPRPSPTEPFPPVLPPPPRTDAVPAPPAPAAPPSTAFAARPAVVAKSWQALDRELALAIEAGKPCDACRIARMALEAVLLEVGSEDRQFRKRAGSLGESTEAFTRMLEDRNQRRQFLEGELRRLAQEILTLRARAAALEKPGAEEKIATEARLQAMTLTRQQLGAVQEITELIRKELTLLEKDLAGLEERLYLAHAFKGYWEVMGRLSSQEGGYWKAHYNAIENIQARLCDLSGENYKIDKRESSAEARNHRAVTDPENYGAIT